MGTDSEESVFGKVTQTTRVEADGPDGIHVTLEMSGDNSKELAKPAIKSAMRTILNGAAAPRYETPGTFGIIGKSPPMRDLFRMMERLAATNATVLITGENGTGKELVARALHDISPRKAKRFVAVNCAAIPSELLESEFFGHKRGSFTGAVVEKQGLFEVADGGTFFMDEIGDMAPQLQVKILRVLQEGTFTPVGGTETRKVDVRIIAATNQDLTAMVKAGTFREDLYYRLHVVALKVPPLRERLDDVPPLVQYFMERLQKKHGGKKRISEGLLARLMQLSWPGNVRELENEMEKLWVLSGKDEVIGELVFDEEVDQFSPRARPTVQRQSSLPPTPPHGTSLPDAVEALERRMITAALERASGNKTRAAEELGISRRNLIRKVQSYGFASSADELEEE